MAHKSPHINGTRLLFGVIVLFAVVAVITHLGEGHRVWDALRSVHPTPIAIAAALQCGTYFCVASILHLAVAGEGKRQTVLHLVPLALVKQFVSQAVPSIGLSGNLTLVRGLERRGFSRPLALRAMLVSLLSHYVAFTVALVAAIAILWMTRDMTPGILTALTLLLLFLSTASLTVVRMKGRASKLLPHCLRHWLVANELSELPESSNAMTWNVRLLTKATVLQLLIFLLDSATLYAVLVSIGVFSSPPVVFASLIAATAVASVGLVPGGLGTFEGTCILLLHAHGVALEAALTGTVLLRGLTFWLPLLPGMILAKREFRLSHNKPAHDS